eukprot:2107606-Rhodomonas_salina.2
MGGMGGSPGMGQYPQAQGGSFNAGHPGQGGAPPPQQQQQQMMQQQQQQQQQQHAMQQVSAEREQVRVRAVGGD